MRYSQGTDEAARLRQEIDDLKRQLEEEKSRHPRPGHGPAANAWRPSRLAIVGILLALTVLIVVGFFAGYLPRKRLNAVVSSESTEQAQALPRAEVIQVHRAVGISELDLPGNIQAITEAPILARADGYLEKRFVDIGDRVQAGQPLAIIAAPELDEQVRQAKAALQQAHDALDQANANLEQGRANRELARVTAERWSKVAGNGGVSKQENDQYQAQYRAQQAAVQSLEKAVAAQTSNVGQAEANLAHINEVQNYRTVKAPFRGVITQRNVDVGALVNPGNTLLFRIAQIDTLRTYVNVPQTNASSIKTGQGAKLRVSNLPGREFSGSVVRTSSALDPATRTLLTEIQVPNADGALLPGMYASVRLMESTAANAKVNMPILVPGDSLQINAQGTKIALLRPDHTVHFQPVEVGRDYGDRLEILSGLSEGDTIVPRPGDALREGVKVEPVVTSEKNKK